MPDRILLRYKGAPKDEDPHWGLESNSLLLREWLCSAAVTGVSVPAMSCTICSP